MVYFIADTHFEDGIFIKYEKRPFENVQHMNTMLVYNWNNVVKHDDIVYVLGDFGNSNNHPDTNLPKIVDWLEGHKYLIKGNHDTMPNKYYRDIGFEEVYDHPIILDEFWILSHEPMYVSDNTPYANICGHVHGDPKYKDFSYRHFIVSVERINYTPISFDEIKRKMSD